MADTLSAFVHGKLIRDSLVHQRHIDLVAIKGEEDNGISLEFNLYTEDNIESFELVFNRDSALNLTSYIQQVLNYGGRLGGVK